MKILTKEIKECTMPDGKKTNVLDLIYTYHGKKDRILVKDYDDKYYNFTLKQLRRAIRDNYNLTKEQGQLAQT